MMAEIDDVQLRHCVRWMEGVSRDAKVFGEISSQTLAEATVAALRELQAWRDGLKKGDSDEKVVS